MADRSSPAPSRTFIGKAIAAVAILLACLIVLQVALRIHWQRQINQRIAAARQAGQPTSLQELNFWPVPPLDGPCRNSFLRDLLADGIVELPDPPESLARFAVPDVLSPEESGYYRRLLDANAEILAGLHEAVNLPVGRQGYDYTLGLDLLWPGLSEFRDAVRLLTVESIIAVQDDRHDDAIRSIIAIAAIADTLQNEPSMVGGLVGTAVHATSLDQIRRLLSSIQLTDVQLFTLADIPQPSSRHKQRLRAALVGERELLRNLIRNSDIRDRALLYRAASGSPRSIPFHFRSLRLIIHFCFDKLEEIVSHDTFERLISATYLPPHHMHPVFQSYEQPKKFPHVIAHMFTPAVDRVGMLYTRIIADSHCASAAIAVERYRLANGRLPDTLDDLIPQFLDAVPLDPFDGQSIRYTRLETGYAIYSVGEDLEDHGPVPAESSPGKWNPVFIVNR